jgi:hypothetical protein
MILTPHELKNQIVGRTLLGATVVLTEAYTKLYEEYQKVKRFVPDINVADTPEGLER